MNSRERVTRALRRDGLPDRVPLQFDLSRPLLDAFSHRLGIPIDWQPNYYEDLKYRTSGNAIRVAMGSDCVVVGGGVPAGYEPERTDDGCIVNEFGMKMKMGIAWYDVVRGPLEDCTTVQQVEDLPFPDPTDEAAFRGRPAHHRALWRRVLHHRHRRADDVRDGLAHDRAAEVHDRHGHGRAVHRGAPRPHDGVQPQHRQAIGGAGGGRHLDRR